MGNPGYCGTRERREDSLARREEIDPQAAKDEILAYCKRKGALAVGVADLEALERIAPPGHRPTDLMPKVKSVIALGVGGQTQGAWSLPAKALGYFGSTETRAYTIAYGCAFFIENRFGIRSTYCPPDMDTESGPRVPLQSLKLHAEIAGIGARSLAGDILLHPDFGYMYFASVFTELELPPDEPMQENPCPAPSCVSLYRKTGQTPCMKFCPVQCLSGEIDADGNQAAMRYDMAACAEMNPAIRGRAVDDRRRGRGQDRHRARRRAVRFRQQDPLVQDVRRLRRAARPVLRMHAGLSDRDPGAAGGPDPALRIRGGRQRLDDARA